MVRTSTQLTFTACTLKPLRECVCVHVCVYDLYMWYIYVCVHNVILLWSAYMGYIQWDALVVLWTLHSIIIRLLYPLHLHVALSSLGMLVYVNTLIVGVCKYINCWCMYNVINFVMNSYMYRLHPSPHIIDPDSRDLVGNLWEELPTTIKPLRLICSRHWINFWTYLDYSWMTFYDVCEFSCIPYCYIHA